MKVQMAGEEIDAEVAMIDQNLSWAGGLLIALRRLRFAGSTVTVCAEARPNVDVIDPASKVVHPGPGRPLG